MVTPLHQVFGSSGSGSGCDWRLPPPLLLLLLLLLLLPPPLMPLLPLLMLP